MNAGFPVSEEEITIALEGFNATPLVPASHMRVYGAARFVGFRGVVPMLGQHGLCAHHALAGLDAVASDLVDLHIHSFLHKQGPLGMDHALVQRRRGQLQTDCLWKLSVFAKESLGSAIRHWLSGCQRRQAGGTRPVLDPIDQAVFDGICDCINQLVDKVVTA